MPLSPSLVLLDTHFCCSRVDLSFHSTVLTVLFSFQEFHAEIDANDPQGHLLKLLEQKHAQETGLLAQWLDESLDPAKAEEVKEASKSERQRILNRLRKQLKSLGPEEKRERHETLREGVLVTKMIKGEDSDASEVPATMFAELQALQNKESEKLIRRADAWVGGTFSLRVCLKICNNIYNNV